MRFIPRIAATCSLLLWPVVGQADTWLLRGTLLTPEVAVENGTLLVDGQTIADLGAGLAVPAGAKSIPLNGIVLPAFIDLHNHLTWNVFPRWRPARGFSNRYEWQDLPEYDRMLRTPQGRMIADGLGCKADIFAEVKAVAGGAASVVGSFARATDGNKCIDGLARNLDFKPGFPSYPAGSPCSGDSSGFPPDAPGVVVNEIFPLEVPNDRFSFYLCELKNGRLRSVLIHLAEGRSNDASARREFRMLRAQNFLVEGLVIIHGAALTPPEFQEMHTKKVGLVWSPRSNDELYGGTANIPAATQAGVTIAIAPDWSPTGSAGMLQEINYAASKYPFVKPQQLVAMATSIPAKLARVDDKIGKLAKGLYADILVIKPRGASPYEAVVTATPADVQLVMIGGEPVYGDYDVLDKLVPASSLVQITVCGAVKGINFKNITESWTDIREKLEASLRRYGSTLSDIECN
jgi:cytosine/adenosine deaminase-related metal-dependent hydrolase